MADIEHFDEIHNEQNRQGRLGPEEFERYRDMLRVSHRTLDAANIFNDTPSLLEAFLQIVKSFTGCNAVSVRIMDSCGHVAYMAHCGFKISDCALDGQLPRARTHCPCSRVANEDTDPSLPWFSDGGSFFSGNACSGNIESSGPCAACSRCEYATTAIIPLRAWDGILGLIHIADSVPGALSEEQVSALESAAMQLGIAIRRKQMEADLKESQRHLQTVFHAIPDLILICDRRRKIVMSNWKALERIESGDLNSGALCRRVRGKANGNCEGCVLHEVFDSGRPAIAEVENPADGGIREIRAFPVLDDDGSVRHVVGNVRDITDIKQGERMLFEAKQEAEFFLDLMTHDLTNYNSVLLGNLLLLERFEPAGESARKYLATCRRQVAKIENLLSKVRAFSMVKHMENNIVEQAELNAMITESLKSLRTLYPRKRIDVSFDPSVNHIARGTDLLEHVIMNILENAVKYADKDHVRIIILVEKTQQHGGDCWEVRISDNGPGVPDDMKEKIFERYSRANSEKKGTGLGLSLSRMIVEKFGGAIAVRDRICGHPDQGSTFVVTLPAVQ